MGKKTFNRSESFFNEECTHPSTTTYQQPVEVKSKRVQLVFRPSTHALATSKAQQQGISLNEYIHRLIEQDSEK